MQNKPLTKEEVKKLDKGFYAHKFENRKKRREEIQKPSSPIGNRLLVHNLGNGHFLKTKERVQRVPIWDYNVAGNPISKYNFAHLGYFIPVYPIEYRSVVHYD